MQWVTHCYTGNILEYPHQDDCDMIRQCAFMRPLCNMQPAVDQDVAIYWLTVTKADEIDTNK